jgi:uncharacterized protein
MRHLVLVAFLSMWANIPTCAQEPCKYGSDDPFDALAKDLSQAKSCDAAAAKMRDCAWGSSADTQLAPIVIAKCEKAFLGNLSPTAQKRYADEMQLCAYEYARQEGTMYMSAAALCQVGVAAHFAADPVAAGQHPLRASFDCDKAQTPLEIAICSDKGLGRADIVLSRVYAGMLKSSDKEGRSGLIQSEKQWLQSIPPKCALSATPLSQKSINCVRNEFEDRFTILDSCSEKITDCLQSFADKANRPAVVPSVPNGRASFDCEAPSSALEIVICADTELGQTDIELAQAYHDADAAMTAVQRKDLIASERQWLRFVSGTCPLGAVGGIPSVLARACVRSAFQTRIVQLQTCPQKKLQERIPCLNDFRLSETKQDRQ